MIDLTGPSITSPGTTVYVSATGFPSGANVEAEASLSTTGDSLPTMVTQEPTGIYRVCVSVPPGVSLDVLAIEVGDGRSYGIKSIGVL